MTELRTSDELFGTVRGYRWDDDDSGGGNERMGQQVGFFFFPPPPPLPLHPLSPFSFFSPQARCSALWIRECWAEAPMFDMQNR